MPKRQSRKQNGGPIGYEAQLWQMADALRSNMDAAEYRHVVPGLFFLKYISDAFGAVKVLGEPTQCGIARELVDAVKRNTTIDWTLRENVRAQLRVIVKRILRKHGYPPDKQERATQLVLEQAAVLSEAWAAP
jgi:hypothetical protein